MSIGAFKISAMLVAFMIAAAMLIAGLGASMHARHRYQPNLIGALIGALLCFLLLEALPAIT